MGGIDAPHLVVDPEARTVCCLGVVARNVDAADICNVNAAVGTKCTNVTSEDIFRKGQELPIVWKSDAVMGDVLIDDADDAEAEEV
jgi:hypothetical protein